MEVPWLTIGATAAATAPWLLAVIVVYLRRRPDKPEPGPPTLDLGPEPPAIANLLVHDFRVTHDAVPATLIDLAARRLVEIEEREPGSYVCRLEKRSDGELTSYESRVMELLRSRASGDIVPTEALTTGPTAESSRWWSYFRKEVVADAQRRGLCLDIIDRKTFRRLSLAAAGPAVVLGLFAGTTAGLVYWVVAFFLLGAIMTWHTQRDTPAGLAAASRWLGVRAIPMGAESDHRAWSSYGGQWRAVRIRYPHLVPPGWGVHPLVVCLRAGIAVAVAVVLLLLAKDIDIGSVTVALSAAVVAVAGLVALRALVDLGSTRDVTGQILRLRTYGRKDDKRWYVAVDDGASATIRAWRVKPELYSPLRQYEVVTGTITRNLRYVRSIRPAVSQTESEVGAAQVAAAPRA